jgi:hypothetical protein
VPAYGVVVQVPEELHRRAAGGGALPQRVVRASGYRAEVAQGVRGGIVHGG